MLPVGHDPQPRLRILIVDDEETIRLTLSLCLEGEGHTVATVGTATEALAAVSRSAFDLVYLDLRLGVDDGLNLIPRVLDENPWTKVVVITAYASVDTAVEAMKRGATDYLAKPFTPLQVAMLTRKIAGQRQLERRLESLQQTAMMRDPEAEVATCDTDMRRAVDLARRVANSNATILITGEPGTGKASIARAIHVWSGRGHSPFCTFSCQSAPPEAVEGELFGISARDVPQSTASARGRVAFAEGGTLLLKEISAAPMTIQPKIVRLLRDREYERQGDFSPRAANVRVIATSTTDLRKAAADGRLREDLLLAVDVVTLDVPPLRRRRGDISLLAERYLAAFADEYQRPARTFAQDAMDALLQHSYPGNVPELRNLVERAVLMCPSEVIALEHLPPNLLNLSAYRVGDLVPLSTIKDLHIRQVLASTRSFESAASILGINSITLWRRRKRYGM